MKFLIFIFWCFVIFYVVRLVGRLLLGAWIERRMKEFTRQQQTEAKRSRAGKRARSAKREGEITVQNIEHKERQVNRSVGEYVDYEEIKDEAGEKK